MQRERQRQHDHVGAVVSHDRRQNLLQHIGSAGHLRGGVDWIARRRERHELEDRALRRFAQFRQRQPDGLRRIGEQHAKTARCRHDRKARSLRQPIRQEAGGGMTEIDQLLDAAHPNGAVTRQQRIKHGVRSRHGPGV